MNNSSVFAICGTVLAIAGKHFADVDLQNAGVLVITVTAVTAVVGWLFKL